MICQHKDCEHWSPVRCLKYQCCRLDEEALQESHDLLEDMVGNIEDDLMNDRIKKVLNLLSKVI